MGIFGDDGRSTTASRLAKGVRTLQSPHSSTYGTLNYEQLKNLQMGVSAPPCVFAVVIGHRDSPFFQNWVFVFSFSVIRNRCADRSVQPDAASIVAEVDHLTLLIYALYVIELEAVCIKLPLLKIYYLSKFTSRSGIT